MNVKPNAVNQDVYLLKEPIKFKAMVDEELLDAQVVSVSYKYGWENEEDEYDEFCLPYAIKWFTIEFSNGHTDEYCHDDDCEVSTSHGYDEYTEALQDELYWLMEVWEEDRPVYSLILPVDGEETTVWTYTLDKTGEIDYSVKFNGDYRFTVKFKDGEWTTLTYRRVNPDPIDQEIADKVISMLKYYQGHPPELIKLPNPYFKRRRLRSELGYAESHLLEVPITFIITVQGELLHARIESVRYEYLGYEDDDDYADITWFKIKFSNGHEDEYYIDDEETCTSKGQDIYTKALHEEIGDELEDWLERWTIYTLGWPIDDIETNVWISRLDDTYYFVSYNGDYRFSVTFENNQWKAITVRIKDPEIIDEELARKVISLVKHYQKKAL